MTGSSDRPTGGAFGLNTDQVRQLALLLQETGLTEIEYAEGDRRIRLTRGLPAAAVPVASSAAPAVAAAAAHAATLAATSATPAPEPVAPASLQAHPGAVKSPMVGTAYVAPEPGAAPFVKVGDSIKAGQTVLIIEAMKVMNPIKAPKAGTVTHLMVTDAQPVEYGEVLLVIE